MKSSYELAMERLNKQAPTVKLSAEQKKQLAEVDSIYAAKIAERQIFVQGELDKALAAGDPEAISQLQRQLASDRKSLEAEREEKKEKIRTSPKA